MTIDAAYRLIQFVFNKNQSGNIKPADFNNIAPIAQMSIINQILGNEQEYQVSHAIPRYGFGITQKIQEDLRNIIKTPQDLTFAGGFAPYPTESLYLFSLIETSSSKIIKPVEHDEAMILNESVIKPPIVGKAIYYVLGANIYILPASITATKITYVRRPAIPVWGYTIVNDVPVYDAGSSQDWEVGEFLHLRICARMLQMIGVNLDLESVTLFATAMEQQGQ